MPRPQSTQNPPPASNPNLTFSLRTYQMTLLVRRDEDDRAVWIAHCLEFNVFGEGRTPAEACADLDEPIDFVVLSDLRDGRDPLDRRAPEAHWAEVDRVRKIGKPVAVVDLPADPAEISVVLAGKTRSYQRVDSTGVWPEPFIQEQAGGWPSLAGNDGTRHVA